MFFKRFIILKFKLKVFTHALFYYIQTTDSDPFAFFFKFYITFNISECLQVTGIVNFSFKNFLLFFIKFS